MVVYHFSADSSRNKRITSQKRDSSISKRRHSVSKISNQASAFVEEFLEPNFEMTASLTIVEREREAGVDGGTIDEDCS
ncbi:hypothetical protein PGB90_008888 [Kerria lacca]